jgi:hypothetical protein
MYAIKEKLNHFEVKFAKVIKFLLSKMVRSGAPDPDPTWPKSSGSESINPVKHTRWYGSVLSKEKNLSIKPLSQNKRGSNGHV